AILGDEQLKAWTKREVGQLGFSVIILAVAIALIGNMEGWVKVLSAASPSQEWKDYVNRVVCCDPTDPAQACLMSPALAGNRPCHIALATDYLQILYESARLQEYSHLLGYGWNAFLSNITFGAALTAFIDLSNASFRPLAFLSMNSDYYSVLFDLTFKTMMFLRIQQVVFDYMWISFFPFMISAGLVLRTFHFSRKLGGMMVALALAVYFVLPMFYVVFDGVLFGFLGGWINGTAVPGQWKNSAGFGTTYQGNTVVPSGQLNNRQIALMDICGSASQKQKTEQQSMLDDLQKKIADATTSNYVKAEEGANDGRFGLQGPIANLAMLMVFTLIGPFIGLMTTLAAFKYFSPLIGGDFEISILSRLI
ncbi:MAG: hypothetical protein QW568_01730, partial [Candidatus Anstonellaceae archaeon]